MYIKIKMYIKNKTYNCNNFKKYLLNFTSYLHNVDTTPTNVRVPYLNTDR